MPPSETSLAVDPHRAIRTPWRWMLVAIGAAFVALGFVGVLLPGLPTTVFLIAASWCFVRSCPHLEQRLRDSRVLGPYMKYVGIGGGGVAMPRRVRVGIIATMWACIALSTLLITRGDVGAWFAPMMIGLGLAGTVAVLVVGRGRGANEAGPGDDRTD